MSRTKQAIPAAAVVAGLVGAAVPAHADPYIPPVGSVVPPVLEAPVPAGAVTMTDPNTGQPVTFVPDTTRHVDVYDSACHDLCPTALTSSVDYAPGQTENFTPPPPVQSLVDTHWAGCRDVDSYTEASHWWGAWTQIFYRLHIWVHWCGDGNGGIKNQQRGQWLSDVWPTYSSGGYHREDAFFYNAWPGLGNYPKSGYHVFGQQEMIAHGLPGFVDAHRYPWGRVIVFADGAEWDEQGGT